MNIRRLAELPLFQDLDDDALRAVASAVTEESVESGRILVREGDFSQDLTIIDEGTARVEQAGQELATLSPGDVYGEAGLLHKEQRNATVVAVSDMRLVHLTKFDINRLRGSAPQITERIEALIAARQE